VRDPKRSRKHDLECLRLASDYMQLVCDVDDPALQQHFLRMANAWFEEAERGLAMAEEEVCLQKKR
jgi:hypothetical protein